MNVIILAAGTGSRMGALTRDRPKALLEVAGRPLLAHLLAHLPDRVCGLADARVVVVGGFCYDRLRAAVRVLAPAALCVENPRYELGNIESLWAARDHCAEAFLLLNSDHLYRPAMFERLVAQRTAIAAACDTDRALAADDMKVLTDGHGRLVRIHKQLPRYDAGYIGITYCPAAHCAAYGEAAATTRARHGPTAPVEWILGTLAEGGYPVSVCDASGIGWVEVDTPDDLAHAEAFLR